MIVIMCEVVGQFWAFQLDTNLPPILPGLSNNLPHAPRSYAPFSDFHVGKVKKVCDNNLPHAGYGRISISGTFETLARI